ncbi:MAG: hypothetical protein WAU75_21605 [Solirubrobacteraceae bacterium]
MPARALTRVIPVLAALPLAGCGLTDPYQQHSPAATTAATTTAATAGRPDQGDPAPERGGTIPTAAQAAQNRLAVDAAKGTPQATLERYAAIYLNWSAANVIAVQHRLAAVSLGQARAQALQAAASAARDPELARSHVANHGQVIAISPGRGPAGGRWVIVTSEQTSGQGDYAGLPPTLHITYAQVTRTRSGWVVSGWAPQN